MTEAHPLTLLLVDDEPNILSSLQRLLRRDGYVILAHDDPRRALETLAARNVDVVLADHRMPGMSGVEFLRRARDLCPDTIRIVLSGYTDLQFITDAINEGAIYKFLTKPWDDEQLREHIRAAFRDKALADENRRLTEALRASLEEKERQEERVRTVLGTLQEVLQLIPWPLLGVDEEGLIALANAAAEEYLGRPGEPLLGRRAEAALPVALRDCLAKADRTTGTAMSFEGWRVECRAMGAHSGSRGRLLALLPRGVGT